MAYETFLAETSSLPKAVDLRLECVPELLEDLRTWLTGPIPGGSVRWSEMGPENLHSNEVPGDATGLGIIFENYPDMKSMS